MGKSVDEISAEYDLQLSEVYAALAYYFDHQEEIDQSVEENDEFILPVSYDNCRDWHEACPGEAVVYICQADSALGKFARLEEISCDD